MIYTVGTEVNYDKGFIEQGEAFAKLGKTGDYRGGFAVNSIEDAKKFIEEQKMEELWAVYEVDADWDKDTEQHEGEWWRRLVKTSKILRKAK